MIQIDIEMPKDCYECPLCHRAFDGNETRLACYGLGAWCLGDEGRLDNCPLHEVTDTDTISRQAVIEINRSYHGQMPNEVNHRIWKEINELPSAQPETHEERTETHTCDYISRQAVLDAIFSEPLYKSGMKKRDSDIIVPAIYEKIKVLPPSPSRPKGRWKTIAFLTAECLECHAQIHELEYGNFCPNCGADMRQ